MSKSDPRFGPSPYVAFSALRNPRSGTVLDALGMKGTEIGTRAGCVLCHLISPRVHTRMDKPLIAYEPPRTTDAPHAQCQERKKSENEGQGIGSLAL